MNQLQQLAEMAKNYKQKYQNGEISSDDYKELINDLNISQQIQDSASELQDDITYREILLGALKLAETI